MRKSRLPYFPRLISRMRNSRLPRVFPHLMKMINDEMGLENVLLDDREVRNMWRQTEYGRLKGGNTQNCEISREQ